MTHMPLGPLFSALILASPAAAAHKVVTCPSSDEVLLSAPLASATRVTAVSFSGARSFPDGALWDLAGGPPAPPLSREEAVALLTRLAQSGLFAAVEPRLLPGDELEIALTEHPHVRSVQVRGLSEFRTEDIVQPLLDAPTDREVQRRRRELRNADPRECPAPLPPRSWLAHEDGGEVRPGVLWQGVRAALGRLMQSLRTRGYPLARVSGELSAAGDLVIEVDEGHVASVEVRGLDSHLSRQVESELGIERGDVFSSGELYSALQRVQKRWPFVRADRGSRRSLPVPDIRLEPRPGGGTAFRSESPADSSPPPVPDDDDFFASFDETSRKYPPRRGWYGFDGDTLILHLRTEQARGKMQWVELLRHTPVTGFAPGLAGTLTIYDPGDRVHLLLDGAVNINTRRATADATGRTFLERLNAQEKVDWLLGPRLRIPALGIAELGGQIHTLTDTADRWRISRIDSYLYSALLNRADREYYRRSGFAAFLTTHLFDELTLGAEYRRDRYAPLAAPSGVWSVFNNGKLLYGAAPVDEGEMGSAVFRLEYHSEKTPVHQVGSMWRNSETSLVPAGMLGLRSLNTVEVADPALGGTFKFTRIVSDTFVTLETGRSDTATLRLRGAGGNDLPLQKQEGLGGWTALRGYDFKEFRGNASLLATLELQENHFGGFLDVGSVHQPGTGWLDPKPSAGILFSFANGSTRAEVAWRLDGHAKLAPDFRILFAVPQ